MNLNGEKRMTDLEICNAATDGPWSMGAFSPIAASIMISNKEEEICEVWSEYGGIVDARFIAHFNPQKVREMLTYIKELEDWREAVYMAYPNIDLDI